MSVADLADYPWDAVAPYAETARLLGMGLGTVQTHVKAIYRKLDVSSKAEAAALAVRAGLS